MKVLAFGEILWDIIEGKGHLGGAPLNFSAHFCQLGGEASLFSAVGNDVLGLEAINKLAVIGIDKGLVQIIDAYPTGTVKIELLKGQPSYDIIKEVAYDYMIKPTSALNSDNSYSAFYFGTLAQRNAKSKQTLEYILKNERFEEVFCDINLRQNAYTDESLKFSLQYATILKLSDEEAGELSLALYDKKLDKESLINALMSDYGQLKIIIVTMGGKGSYVTDRNQTLNISAYPSDVLDTIGAGDSYSATFLYYYLQNADLEKSADNASKVAAFVASKAGAIPGYDSALLDSLKS